MSIPPYLTTVIWMRSAVCSIFSSPSPSNVARSTITNEAFITVLTVTARISLAFLKVLLLLLCHLGHLFTNGCFLCFLLCSWHGTSFACCTWRFLLTSVAAMFEVYITRLHNEFIRQAIIECILLNFIFFIANELLDDLTNGHLMAIPLHVLLISANSVSWSNNCVET